MKTIHRAYLLSGLFSAATAFASTPATHPQAVLDLAKSQGAVEFVAIGRPSALKIHGTGAPPKGEFTLDKSRVYGAVTFDLVSLDTGIAMRDKHMKEKYLEASRYPEAKLQISKIALPKKLPAGDFKLENVAFEGPLTLHGETKTVHGTASIAHAGSQMLVQAQFGLKLSEYGIDTPTFAGISVADEVNVNVHTESPWRSSI
jgi:polyisoprenoid-binding protein YceI